jgi:DnaJ-class molecular chaperone
MLVDHGLPIAASFDGYVQPCHTCDGSGVVPRAWVLPHMWFKVRGVVECPACDGLGFTKVSCCDETPTREFDLVR